MNWIPVCIIISLLLEVVTATHKLKKPITCYCFYLSKFTDLFMEIDTEGCQCGCLAFTNPNVQSCCKVCPRQLCFHGDSDVITENGSVMKMKYLTEGQKILTVVNGERTFTEVKTFIKRKPYTNATYRTLTTETGNHVTISDDHLIFVSSNNRSTDIVARFAMLVEEGDYIFSTLTCSRGLCPDRVVEISYSQKQGLYVPLTDTGTLIVDGIFASNHGFIDHDLEHFFLTPFRWFPWLLKPWQQDGYSPLIRLMTYFGSFLRG